MRLALAQLNPVVGDLRGNAERILAAARDASAEGATLLLTPELSLWGYPPRDLLLQPARLALQSRVLDELVTRLDGLCPLLVGVALPCDDHRAPGLYNGIALVDQQGYLSGWGDGLEPIGFVCKIDFAVFEFNTLHLQYNPRALCIGAGGVTDQYRDLLAHNSAVFPGWCVTGWVSSRC